MIHISIPGREKNIEIKNLLLDLNGTLTTNGVLIEGVKERIDILKDKLKIFLLTADTFGVGKDIAAELGIELIAVSGDNGSNDKLDFLNTLNREHTGAIGNGYNDELMLGNAAISVAVIGNEGCSFRALNNADIIVHNINDGLDLFVYPLRIVATLRG
ncbi:hypothetical protein SYNTR_0257 [Candidatus Syntrophocurvum alkaliphilum]|uniref:HAD family hydrolase, a n=1 Tax=Candidatus Syntrophocurvum alkaliphilum TaxID=2293317 RepID=A0A6I6DCI6_9FIRM|nr:HAD family hydrolase [Candidatus Syntrophocurvum alkaliphilum]QGT98850.1 hypothetical protein SYNTR_0257 [Candidatus Syntrophocurvum alkaliphilum]